MDEEESGNTSDHEGVFPSEFVECGVEIKVEEDGEVTINDYVPPAPPPSVRPVLMRKVRSRNTKPKKSKRVKRRRSPGQSLLCDHCDYKTKHYISLQRHIIGKHQDKERIIHECSECPYKSIFKTNLNKHRKQHTTEKKFKCDRCDFTSKYKHGYNRHMKIHDNRGNAYKCDKCPFITNFEGHIIRHLSISHNEVSIKALKCQNCNFITKVGSRLNSHNKQSKQNEEIKCDVCDFSTLFKCAYKIHKSMHTVFNSVMSSKQDKLFVENPEFDSSPSLPDFKATPDIQNLFTTDTTAELDWNKLPVHEILGDLRFQCTECEYKSKFKASVQRHHYRKHLDIKNPYKCINCNTSTKTKDKMILHVKRSISNQLNCSICGFISFYKCQMQTHELEHNNLKCSECSYTCKTEKDVQRHFNNVHNVSVERFKCQYCDFTVGRRELIVRHEATHTGVKPFQCGICSYSCMRRKLLDLHVIKKHNMVRNNDIVFIDDSKIERLKDNVPKVSPIGFGNL